MLDFTSALYLGLRHESGLLPNWPQLTTGRPAAIETQPDGIELARRLAVLQGCEDAIVGPSTWHVFWDLFGLLAASPTSIYMDAGAYPIARWGIERAAARGVPVRRFEHFDAESLRRQLATSYDSRRRPVAVTDGFCPGCGRIAPIRAYLEAIQPLGGYLILDDTQALGVLGQSPCPAAPYGSGGGGSLRWTGCTGRDVILVSSLAKAFGAPLAMLSGNRQLVKEFQSASQTRVHCSPPCRAAILAAERAMDITRRRGDHIRLHLAQMVARFRTLARNRGLNLIGGMFPVQSLPCGSREEAICLHQGLSRQGVRAVLQGPGHGHPARIAFVITASHGPEQIDPAVKALAFSCRAALSGRRSGRRALHTRWTRAGSWQRRGEP